MSQHYTRSTVSVAAFCKKCEKTTQHRVNDRRISDCLECIDKLEAQHQKKKTPRETARQEELFK